MVWSLSVFHHMHNRETQEASMGIQIQERSRVFTAENHKKQYAEVSDISVSNITRIPNKNFHSSTTMT